MALWLVDMAQFPAYCSMMLADVSGNPVLEGHLDTVAMEAFGDWVTKMTNSHQAHLVTGAGAFKHKFAALMARARVVGLEPGAALARYLREEVLAAKSAEGEAPPSHRRSARSSALASHIATKIRGLEVVLTMICEAMESRVAELTKPGAGAGAGAGTVSTAPSRPGSPVIADGEKEGTIAAPGVTAAAFAEEQGSGRKQSGREIDRGEDAEQQRHRGEGGGVGGDTVVGASAAVAMTIAAAAASEPRALSVPTSGRDAAGQRGDNDEPSGDMSTLVSEESQSCTVRIFTGTFELEFSSRTNVCFPLWLRRTHTVSVVPHQPYDKKCAASTEQNYTNPVRLEQASCPCSVTGVSVEPVERAQPTAPQHIPPPSFAICLRTRRVVLSRSWRS